MPAYIDIAAAAARLKTAGRVLLVGCSGSGKSRLSHSLCGRFGLRHISMDRDIFWLPGWTKRPKAEERRLLADFVAGDRWLMDGTDPSSFDIRLPRTDIVIWMRMPRWLCLWGVTTRWLRWIGRTRPDMAPGCPERLERDFLRYIWTFEEKMAPRIVAGLNQHGGQIPVLVLENRKDVRRLLAFVV